MIIRGKVPLRVSFAGGGTDVAPYCDDFGGAVLSSTIDLFAYASIELRKDRNVHVHSLDYGTSLKYDIDKKISFDGRLDLIKAIISYMNLDCGVNLFIHNDAPPGSGLGSSGCIGSMIVGMIAHLMNRRMTRNEIAEIALHVERDILKIAGGKQDQYSGVYGGINYIEFEKDRTLVNQLRIDPDVLRELEYHLLLVYTKKNHYSSDLIESQVKLYKDKNKDSLEGLHNLKENAKLIKDALVSGKLGEFAKLLHDSWENKKRMNPLVSTPYVDELYNEARKLGAIGGKILGAGGGGYLLLFTPFQRKHLVAEKVQSMGAEVVNFSFIQDGLKIWETQKEDLGYQSSDMLLEDCSFV